MDTDLARTFLAVAENGSFIAAAKHLHVAQATVSARIRNLESLLRRALFIRNKAGAILTPAGEQFLRYAPAFIQVWERARHQVAVPAGRRAVLAVGTELSMWDPLLSKWLIMMKRRNSDIAIRSQVNLPAELMRQVANGILDIAITYRPHNLAGMTVEKLAEEKLVLVTTEKQRRKQAASNYVYVDWGPEFIAYHDAKFPDLVDAGVYVGLGPLGLSYILEAGGSGYFRHRSVRSYLAEGRLTLVPNAPAFLYPAYAVYSTTADAGLLGPALKVLRSVAAAQIGPESP